MASDKKREPRRRTREIDAAQTYVPEDSDDGVEMHAVFRKRLTYLMNGNNKMDKPVNIQELADAVGVSRTAIQKYLKPKGKPTTPSALNIYQIANFFSTTPDFLLGFDGPADDSARLAFESEFYNRLGLNQSTIDRLRSLRSMQSDETVSSLASSLMSILDSQISNFVDGALKSLESFRSRAAGPDKDGSD